MAAVYPVTSDELDELRRHSLRTVLFGLAVGVYIWCVILFFTNHRFTVVWLGPVLLIGGLVFAFITWRHSSSWAATAAITGVAAAVLYNVWLSGPGAAPYILAVVVSLTGLLFGLSEVIWLTLLCSGSVVAIGSLRWGFPPTAPELLAPALVIGVVGILSSLAVRNLYTALYWALDRTMAAQHNLEELRERQAQLARTLKALDEAYQRLEHANYDLAQAREAAEETKSDKQKFVTHVSHELRTPLNVIVAFAETMYLSPESYEGVPLPSQYRGDVREVYRSSQHLLHLIDDVLDMSQIEAGRLRVRQEWASLLDVVQEAVEMIRPLVPEQVALRADVPPDLPQVLIDRARIQQVLLNLLNNARRFTAQGSISVQATSEKGEIRVTVSDTGVGIPPSEQHKVFKEFQHLDGAIAGHHDGTGVGLAISKRFVEIHGGRIWVESDGVPGHGSHFHFTLPTGESVKMSPLHESPMPLRRPGGRGRTLLLLGQDPNVARMLEQALDDYAIVPLSETSQIPRLARELQASAVLLDAVHPEEMEEHLRAVHRTMADSSVPIILCPLMGERHLGASLGVLDYLIKPITREALTGLLDRLTGDLRRILIVDDDPRMARILSRMLHATGRQVEIVWAENGVEGLREMREQRPDLVLLDLVMPEMDGYNVLARMKEDPELCPVPVTIITAQAHTPLEERQMGGNTLTVFNAAGFTNNQILAYLRGILGVVSVPSAGSQADSAPLARSEQAVQSGEQVRLSHRLREIGDSAQ